MVNKTILITGGCGFVGHHFVEHFIKTLPEARIIVMDKLNYSGSLDRLRDIECYPRGNVQVLTSDFSLPISENVQKELKDVTHIIHMGAESHVDNSITNPEPFVVSNVLGTMHMLNLARKLERLETFYYFSTDEVYGPADLHDEVGYGEFSPDFPANPYAASKAGGDMLVKAFCNTYGIKCITTRTMNIVGERQHPEKFLPLCINKLLKGETIFIHGTPDKLTAGRRTYIHARNVANAYSFLMSKDIFSDTPPDFYKNYRVYNIVGEKEVSNLELASMISEILQEPLHYEIVDFHSSRPGHDIKYKMSGKKLASLGWTPPVDLYNSVRKTVLWYLENKKWLQKS